MRWTRALRVACSCAVAAQLAGCPAPPPVARPYPPPSASELLAHLATRARRVTSSRSEVKVDYLAKKGERVKVTMTFLVEAPDKLRIEADSPFGGAVASLASDGHDFELLDIRNNRFLAGEASPCNIARLIRVELTAPEVIAILHGGAPLLDVNEGGAEVGWDGTEGGREVLTLRGRDGRVETVKLAAPDRRWDVVEAELRGADGKVAWRIEHRDFHDVGEVRLPDRTDVLQPARDADARLRYRSREVNLKVPAGAFRLTPPSGLSVENVRCE